MTTDRDYLYPAVSMADATWREVGNVHTETALLASGVGAAHILAKSAAKGISASFTTRIELFRDVIQLSSVAVASIWVKLNPVFKVVHIWNQLVRPTPPPSCEMDPVTPSHPRCLDPCSSSWTSALPRLPACISWATSLC